MPTDPGPSTWRFDFSLRGESDLVARGADLEPSTLLAAYQSAIFPMPLGEELTPAQGRSGDPADPMDPMDPADPMAWWSPVHRGVLPLHGLRVSRSLRAATRRFEIRLDTRFSEVVAACADPSRPGAWIDAGMLTAYDELHRLGWAHSVETWQDDRLVGGLFGLAIGGLFAGESMFSRERDASKVSLVALRDLLDDEYADGRLIDTQWQTPHLESLGVVEISRREYLTRLRAALPLPLPAPFA